MKKLCNRKICCFDKVYDYLKKFLFWNQIIRYIFESYISQMLVCIAYFGKNLDWSNKYQMLPGLYSALVITLFVLAPICMTIFFYKRTNKFRNMRFLEKFSEAIEKFKWRHRLASFYISIFCYRRLLLVLLILFLPNQPYAQIIL